MLKEATMPRKDWLAGAAVGMLVVGLWGGCTDFGSEGAKEAQGGDKDILQ